MFLQTQKRNGENSSIIFEYSNVQNTPLVLLYRSRQSPFWSFKFEVLVIVSYFGFRISNLPLNQSKNSVPHPLCPAVPFVGKDQFSKEGVLCFERGGYYCPMVQVVPTIGGSDKVVSSVTHTTTVYTPSLVGVQVQLLEGS